eukprot:278994-Chlamydomonas_euryale.AAC.1
MTQSAMLHISASGRLDADRVAAALQALQTSSPSYVLMASLDAARAHAAAPLLAGDGGGGGQTNGDGCFLDEPLRAAAVAREGLVKLHGVVLLASGDDEKSKESGDESGKEGGDSQGGSKDSGTGRQGGVCGGAAGGRAAPLMRWDPLRLTIGVWRLGVSGYAAAAALEARAGVVAELATPRCVVCALGPGSTTHDAERLVDAVRELSNKAREACGGGGGLAGDAARGGATGPAAAPPQLPPPVAVMTPREAFFSRTERTTASAAVGRVCAELLCPYPPGVPALIPGEVVSEQALAVLCTALAGGGAVTGAADSSLETLLVVLDEDSN